MNFDRRHNPSRHYDQVSSFYHSQGDSQGEEIVWVIWSIVHAVS